MTFSTFLSLPNQVSFLYIYQKVYPLTLESVDDEDEDDEFDIMTDEETDAELEHGTEEHSDVLHPDMVTLLLFLTTKKSKH
jgi:hypothetical protein